MRKIAFESEIAAVTEEPIGPLGWWRTLAVNQFIQQRKTVETAAASLVSTTLLAPPELVSGLVVEVAAERCRTWLDLSCRFHRLDAMQSGVAAEVAGTYAALAAAECDPLGLVLLINRLSQPFTRFELPPRISVAASWLAARGVLLNPTVLRDLDWTPCFTTGDPA